MFETQSRIPEIVRLGRFRLPYGSILSAFHPTDRFIMTTRSSGAFFQIPLRHTAASSSLPPELKALLNQFGNQFWQFDAATIAQMLSPTVTLPSNLVDVAHSFLKQKPSDWGKDAEESSFHEPLVNSLNDFLDASHRAFDLSEPQIIEREARWCAGLRFMELEDRPCAVHSRDRGPIKREAVAGVSFPKGDEYADLAIPVKLDEDWPAVVAQAARSAQLMYSVCHLRKFLLVIGFRYTTLELRFLVIHRGGVTASKPLSVVEEEGNKDILRVFLSMLMWRSEEDVGIPRFFREGVDVKISTGTS